MSPSVVGRTGIAYFDCHSLGWTPVKKSFVDSLPPKLFDADRIECLNDMFEWLMPPVLRNLKWTDCTGFDRSLFIKLLYVNIVGSEF